MHWAETLDHLSGRCRFGRLVPVEFEPPRHIPRVRRTLSVWTREGVEGEVVDLSAVGLRVQAIAELAPTGRFEGELLLEDGRRVAVSGIVAWRSPADIPGFTAGEIGVELVEPTEEYLRVVASLFAAS
ncbi:MAG: PilZ domain-containing protein [Myxococcaceae bacterium]